MYVGDRTDRGEKMYVSVVDFKNFCGNSGNMVPAQNQPPPFSNLGMAIITRLFTRLNMGGGGHGIS